MKSITGVAITISGALLSLGALQYASAQDASPKPVMTPEQVRAAMAADPQLFLKTARTAMKWDEAAEPMKIAGPIYFVGTKGLAVWLIRGSAGDVLLNTAMQDSGPMIESSIRKLGFDPQNIGWLLTGHAHVDHVGGHAYIKQLTGARVAVAREEVTLLESGGKGDFNYDRVPGFDFAPVKVDRVLRDGDVIKLGNIALTAHVTPGHNLGAITWTMEFADGGTLYNVVFPDGSGVNPGFRVARNPSYPGIEGDYRHTLHVLESLKPDIWLHSHTDTMGFAAKAARARTEGVRAWVDPEGYRKWVASERAKFEDEVSAEISEVSMTNAP
jgi:metallo-beta-lactamase class B